MSKLKELVDEKMIKFLLVGVINTMVGIGVMFIAYNFLHLGYWISSALNYILGSIVSYVLNKNFTFKSNNNETQAIIKFLINIACCYLIAYGGAKPLMFLIFKDFEQQIRDNLSMLTGMCIFVIINYIGQRYFVFGNTYKKRQ